MMDILHHIIHPHMNLPEQKNKAITLHKHANDWPTEQDQTHAPQKEERASQFLPLEEELSGLPGSDDEDQSSEEENLTESLNMLENIILRLSR